MVWVRGMDADGGRGRPTFSIEVRFTKIDGVEVPIRASYIDPFTGDVRRFYRSVDHDIDAREYALLDILKRYPEAVLGGKDGGL